MCTRAPPQLATCLVPVLGISLLYLVFSASTLPASSVSSSQANPQSNTPSSSASSMYSASVNPPRKAKLQAAASLLPALLPSPPSSDSSSSNFSISIVASAPESVQPKKKRGRKPTSGGSSRAAREAARKANHSRIEKARRGKINDALQELKRLIPADFAAGRENVEDDDDDEDADFAPASSSKKESGKKGASEREFKLDILERTVLFVRALLKRVDENGQPGDFEGSKQASNYNCQCHNASNERGLKKRKVVEQEEGAQVKKRRTTSQVDEGRVHVSDMDDDDDSETGSCADTDDDNDAAEDVATVIPSHSPSNEHSNRVRLPSISELLSSPVEIGSSRMYTQQLPSPSLSPQTSSHYYTGQKSSSHFVSSLSSPIPPQVCSFASAEIEDAPHPCEAHDGTSDSRISYPMGMSYLLTPPSPNVTSNSNPHTRTPALRLPSSALELRDVSEECVVTSGTEVDVEIEDGGARTATLALLQMRSTSYSRAGTQSSAVKEMDKTRTARTSLTPGGLLGIQTGERPR
ncbi:hypothetical protein ACEPAF_2735 [Sanghuangporus sanghuang]